MNANDKQVGGDHYKGNGELQHWDVVIALNWDYLLGAATKYLWRLGRKGDDDKAIEDIGKAIHYLEKKREVMIAARAASKIALQNQLAAFYEDDEASPGYVNQDR